MELLLVAARVRAAWGWSIRWPGATHPPASLPLPPPSSVIGFYSYSLARRLGLPEQVQRGGRVESTAALLARFSYAAAARLVEGCCIVAPATASMLVAPYSRSADFMAAPYALTSAPSSVVELVIGVDAAGLASALGISEDEVVASLCPPSSPRLGSSEGLVSLVDWMCGWSAVRLGFFKTSYYLPVEWLAGAAAYASMEAWSPWSGCPYEAGCSEVEVVELAIPGGRLAGEATLLCATPAKLPARGAYAMLHSEAVPVARWSGVEEDSARGG